MERPGTFHALRLLSAIYFLAQYTIVSVKNYVGLRFLHRRRGYLGSFKELWLERHLEKKRDLLAVGSHS